MTTTCSCGKLIQLDDCDTPLIKGQRLTCKGVEKSIHLGNRPQPKLNHLMFPDRGNMEVDHINHDVHDNRRANLRLVTHQQNLFNRRSFKHTTSKYKGVCFNRAKGKWQAAIKHNNVSIYLGLFAEEHEAAKAYNAKAVELQGQHACLNNIE